MGEAGVRRLLKQGSLERVARDAETARQEVEAAFRHLTSAARIADVDSSGAFALGYDAMRKVISGHLRAAGLRVAKGVGHHVRTESDVWRWCSRCATIVRWEMMSQSESYETRRQRSCGGSRRGSVCGSQWTGGRLRS